MTFSSPCEPLPTNDDIGSVLLMPAAISIAPSAITTLLRLWARRKALGADDWMILLAAVLTIHMNALSIASVRHGRGRHVCFLEDRSIAAIERWSYIAQISFVWALFFIKTSICLLVLRVKDTKLLRWTSAMVTVLMVASTVVVCAALLAECRPIAAYWDRNSGWCRPPTFRIYSIWVQAAVSVFTDLICCLLPFAILWSLPLSPLRKFAVGVLIAFGAIAFVFAILRAQSLSLGLKDTTYDYTITGTWMVLEANIGLIASNIGPINALLPWRRQPKPSYTHDTQDFASHVRQSDLDARLPVDDNDSDHSLFHSRTDSQQKHNTIHIATSIHRISEDIHMDRVHTADSQALPRDLEVRW